MSWVLCSKGRLKRPWLGRRDEIKRPPTSSYDPECYICPGNRRASGARNPKYEDVFVFDNDFPALVDENGPSSESAHPLLLSKPEPGRCRVVSFSPRHDVHLGELSPQGARRVVDAWAEETERLHVDDAAGFVQVFENRGTMMGASNPHPHGQIWGVGKRANAPKPKSGDASTLLGRARP